MYLSQEEKNILLSLISRSESLEHGDTQTKAVVPSWISVKKELPHDGVLVVVKTKDGAKYFGSAYEGKLMPNVEYWYPIPE